MRSCLALSAFLLASATVASTGEELRRVKSKSKKSKCTVLDLCFVPAGITLRVQNGTQEIIGGFTAGGGDKTMLLTDVLLGDCYTTDVADLETVGTFVGDVVMAGYVPRDPTEYWRLGQGQMELEIPDEGTGSIGFQYTHFTTFSGRMDAMVTGGTKDFGCATGFIEFGVYTFIEQSNGESIGVRPLITHLCNKKFC